MKKQAKKTPRPGERAAAEDHPTGTLLRWPSPPTVRVGAYGLRPAPSAEGVVTMIINGSPIARFALGPGRWSEPCELWPGQPCEVVL